MGMVRAVCISEKKGTAKRNVDTAELVVQHGLKGDAHAGNGHRQVSLLAYEKVKAFSGGDIQIAHGDFGENIVADGIDFARLAIGTKLRCGNALLEVSQIGKECHNRCAIFNRMGDCIMPREGIFGVVLVGGTVKTGDTIEIEVLA